MYIFYAIYKAEVHTIDRCKSPLEAGEGSGEQVL